jgi:hypothetical protein
MQSNAEKLLSLSVQSNPLTEVKSSTKIQQAKGYISSSSIPLVSLIKKATKKIEMAADRV